MFNKRVLNIFSVITGIFFIISGIGKITDTTAFSNLIEHYGLGHLMIFAPLIVIFEILLGLFLLLLIKPKRTSFFVFILLIIFTASFAYGHFKHGINDCGCMGSIRLTKETPAFTFIRNIILMFMSFTVWYKYPEVETKTAKWKKNLIWTLICPAIFISGLTFSIPDFVFSKPAKHKFQDKNIKNTELAKYIKTSPDSTYLVFCFKYTCPHCWNSIANLRDYKTSKTVDKIFSFGTGPDSSRVFFMQNFHPDFYVKNLSLDAIHKLTDLFPTTFYIKHDTIKDVIKGELYTHVIFQILNAK